MKPPAPYLPAAFPALSDTDQEALTDLYVRGTPENTLRAYERDLIYVTAWKATRCGSALDWPESEATALAFILDHARDLGDAPDTDIALQTAETLIAQGLRKSLACPAPSTLDRRIASWLAFHRMKNLPSPLDAPQIKQARAKARRAAARPPAPKSAHPITRDVLEQLLATCRGSRRDCRDRAILMLGWASGGRRRSEITGLMFEDVSLKEFDEKGLVWISLLETKTTTKGETPRLVLKGRAAQALVHWVEVGQIKKGPLFKPVSKADRVLKRRLSPDAIYQIVRHRLKLAGLPQDFASPHGLRSGFLTQAALDGAPIQAAMRLSLHRSLAQAQKYYDDVDIAENPATELLG
ncbi:tyrosine-type recombinase/integrase (plasmid) [Ruegeria sp. SCSIO 43209]|uniref:tyrosine-type recombinase/integrase n=1 Tax=Ruegeria sp. SCSIO 43209 TaxID=2793010 RepID=UPI001CA82B76|nr:tyrosine-type recombinase/integrase [Ruegeria sp. SCSIO 43209]UAB91066.1 tyrosine-type recombinase/integrase [Ruegeria sp. SCSIO 43209]